MILSRTMGLLCLTVCLAAAQAAPAYTLTSLGRAGGWDDINKSTTTTAVIDASGFTADTADLLVSTALINAFNTWDNVAGASRLNFNILADNGGNYDVFDGPVDAAGPPWFNGYSNTLDSAAHWRYANIAIGGWLPNSYFTNLDPASGSNILAVTWAAKLSGDGSAKSAWHAEIFFNDGWAWTTEAAAATGNVIDIETVALHELGHALGLDHSSGVTAVMNPYYAGVRRALFADDINGVTALYSLSSGGGGKGGGPRRLTDLEADADDLMLVGVTYADTFQPAVENPEPSTFLLGIAGLAGLALLACRHYRRV